jgi:hypothetical protein
MKNSNKVKRKNKKIRQSSQNDGIDAMRNQMLKIPRAAKIVPDRLYTKLVYEGMGPVVITTTDTYKTLRFRPSGAFDVDPTVFSTATPGFAELAQFYSYYRVTTSRCTICITNPSTSLGIVLVVLPLVTDPGASPVGVIVNAWPDQPYAKQKMCGLLGSPPASVVNEISTERLFGTKAVYVDDAYASQVNTTPIFNWYWGVGILSGSVPASNISVTMQYKIEMGVEFYARKVLQQ